MRLGDHHSRCHSTMNPDLRDWEEQPLVGVPSPAAARELGDMHGRERGAACVEGSGVQEKEGERLGL